MTPMVFILVFIGVGCTTGLFMRFILWLDGADECEEDAPAAERAEEHATAKERRRAA